MVLLELFISVQVPLFSFFCHLYSIVPPLPPDAKEELVISLGSKSEQLDSSPEIVPGLVILLHVVKPKLFPQLICPLEEKLNAFSEVVVKEEPCGKVV